MYFYFIVILIPFLINLQFIPILKKLAKKYKLYDRPEDGILKPHQKPIPYIGGVGIYVAFILGGAMLSYLDKINTSTFLYIALTSLIMLFFGLWDDIKWKRTQDSRPILKLAIQIILVSVVAYLVFQNNFTTSNLIHLIWIIPAISFYLMANINALNMEDGLDGLASGITLISLIGFCLVLYFLGNINLLNLGLLLIGSILGFLIYNWNPASIFMGDSGSFFLGSFLGICALSLTNFSNPIKIIAPLLIVGLPIIDTSYVMLYRILHKKSPFLGDRNHFYDKINRKLRSVKKTVLLYYLIQSIIVLIGVLLYYYSK